MLRTARLFVVLSILLIDAPLAAQLQSAGSQHWYQGSPGFVGAPAAGDLFGQAVAVGDFDGDGFGDIAIGAAGEEVGGFAGAGTVQVLYGSAAGVDVAGMQTFTLSTAGVPGAPREQAFFGFALAAGDFDDDEIDDLAIGVPGLAFLFNAPPGGVVVLYGGGGGLTTTGAQQLDRTSSPVMNGWSLAVGDFDGDGIDDLAAGAPLDDIQKLDGFADAGGRIAEYHGSAAGLGLVAEWSQDTAGVEGDAQDDDRFGWSVAAGDFDGDGRDDLAVGTPGETTEAGGAASAGAVQILYGAGGGLAATGDQLVLGTDLVLFGSAEAGAFFGFALAAGDLDGDGHDDLAVGTPLGDRAAGADAGRVSVVFGTSSGLDPSPAGGARVLGKASWGETEAAGDELGNSVLIADFDADGFAELAIGVPGEDGPVFGDEGELVVLRGGPGGPSLDSFLRFTQHDIPGGAAPADRLGGQSAGLTDAAGNHLLAGGDVDGDGALELVVGIPGDQPFLDLSDPTDFGGVNVVPGVRAILFADGFESGDTSAWN